MAPTIDEVAAAAGTSRSTASRALSGHPSVLPATRARVQAAAERLDYHVDPVARALRAGTSGLIGLLLTNLFNASIQSIAATAQAAARAQGNEVLIATTDGDANRERELVNLLRSHRIDGLVVMSSGANTEMINGLHERGLPVVSLIRLPRGVTTPAVVYDDFDAARQAARHLTALGHTRVAFLGGPSSTRSGRERYAGFRATMAHAHASVVPEWVFRGPFEPDFGVASAARLVRLLQGRLRPTALVIANHEAMSGALQVLAQSGIEIPSRLSVVGIEDAELLRFWHPAVTVVDTNPAALARRAIETLLGGRSHQAAGQTLTVPAVLISRDSTAPP